MAVKYRKQTGSFRAKDSKGNEHSIFIYTDFIDAGDLQDPNAVIPGMKCLKTRDGSSVNRIDQGRYQVIGGMLPIDLTSDDPAAV
jgi:hypothetical protein